MQMIISLQMFISTVSWEVFWRNYLMHSPEQWPILEMSHNLFLCQNVVLVAGCLPIFYSTEHQLVEVLTTCA